MRRFRAQDAIPALCLAMTLCAVVTASGLTGVPAGRSNGNESFRCTVHWLAARSAQFGWDLRADGVTLGGGQEGQNGNSGLHLAAHQSAGTGGA
jgi:hypothetical protein